MVFGCGCQPAKLLTPLYKETYLQEFLTDTDKKIARMNLGITDNVDISDIKDQLKKEILKELENNNSGNNQGNNQNNPSDNPGKDDPGNTDNPGGEDNPGGNTSGGNNNPSSGGQEQVGDEFDELDSGESNL